jgi:hypothetical protein
MKRILAPALMTPSAALAHPWGHDGMTVASLLQHFAAQPDHAALILGLLGIGAYLLYRAWVRK